MSMDIEKHLTNQIRLDRAFLSSAEADRFMALLVKEVSWQTETLFLFGRQVKVPRLIAWHGDRQAIYRYSGKYHHPLPWTETLLALKNRVENALSVPFNAVLLNLYRNGQDSMSWHSDDEPELGETPVIASVSLGAARDFQFRPRHQRGETLTMSLPHGSLLTMFNDCQQLWQHQLPKRLRVNQPRINLTFRQIYPRQPRAAAR